MRLPLCLLCLLLLAPSSVLGFDQLNFNLVMPELSCGKGEQQPHECTLSGRFAVRGPNELTGAVRYYCDIRYSYVAAGSESQEIRFTGRTIYHGEVQVTNGRARLQLEVPLSVSVPQKARKIELAEVACYQDRK